MADNSSARTYARAAHRDDESEYMGARLEQRRRCVDVWKIAGMHAKMWYTQNAAASGVISTLMILGQEEYAPKRITMPIAVDNVLPTPTPPKKSRKRVRPKPQVPDVLVAVKKKKARAPMRAHPRTSIPLINNSTVHSSSAPMSVVKKKQTRAPMSAHRRITIEMIPTPKRKRKSIAVNRRTNLAKCIQ